MICTIIWVMPFLVGFPQWKNQKPKPTPNPPFGIMPGRAAAAKNYACSQLVLMGSQALQRF
jgi:hypothetical protein